MPSHAIQGVVDILVKAHVIYAGTDKELGHMLSPEVNFSEIKEPSPSDELLSYEEKPPNPQVQEDMPPTLKEIPSKCSWHIHKNGVKGCAAWHHSACGHVDSEACTHSFPRATSVPLGAIKDQECLPALTCTDHISGLMKTKLCCDSCTPVPLYTTAVVDDM